MARLNITLTQDVLDAAYTVATLTNRSTSNWAAHVITEAVRSYMKSPRTASPHAALTPAEYETVLQSPPVKRPSDGAAPNNADVTGFFRGLTPKP